MPVERIKPEPMKKIKGQPHLLAYITPNEVEKLKALGGQETMTKEGIPAYPEYDNYGYSSQSDFDAGDRSKSNDPNVRGTAPGQNRVTAAQLAAINAKEKEVARIAKEKLDKRKAKNKNITKFGYNKPKSKLGGILGTIAGMMMGIPGLGLLTGGLGNLKGKIGDTFEDFTGTMRGINPITGKPNTQAEYEAARQQRQLQGRLDNMYDRKSKGKNFSQKNMDMLEAMGLQPSTAQNVLTGRDLKGFTESRGLQTPQTFSDPFANTVGTTTKVNAPSNDAVSSVTRDYSGIEDYGVDINPQGPGRGFLESLGFTPGHTAAIDAMDKNFTGSQFDYSAAATKDMVNRASNPLTAALSAIGNVVGRPGYDAVDAAKEYSKKGYQGEFSFSPQGAVDFGKNLGALGKEFLDQKPGTMMAGALTGGLQALSDRFSNPFISSAAAAEVRPTIGVESTPFGSMPTGDVGLNTSGRLGNLSGTVNAIDALKGESVNPQFNYSGDFGNTNVYGNYSDDVQNLGLNFNNDKGLSGGISYDAITGEPRFDIGLRRTFADGGLASMFTRRR